MVQERKDFVFFSIIIRSPMPEKHQEKAPSVKVENAEIEKKGRINTP